MYDYCSNNIYIIYFYKIFFSKEETDLFISLTKSASTNDVVKKYAKQLKLPTIQLWLVFDFLVSSRFTKLITKNHNHT